MHGEQPGMNTLIHTVTRLRLGHFHIVVITTLQITETNAVYI